MLQTLDVAQLFENLNLNDAVQTNSLTYHINKENGKATKFQTEMQLGEKLQVHENWQHVDQIQSHNPFTYAAFMLMRKEYEITNRGVFKTVELFHSTPSHNVSSILLNNFDYRKNPKNRRRYGPGIYFSNDLGSSCKCTIKKISDGFSVIVADVLIGETVYRDKYKRVNKISIDTGVNRAENFFVKAREDEFYPKFIHRYMVIRS